jgi:hypothetical protein
MFDKSKMNFSWLKRLRGLPALWLCVAMASLAPPCASAQEQGDTAATAAPAPPPGGLVSGYMELHYNNLDTQPGQLDFHRFVLLLTHAFSPRLRFTGELEVAHAVVEGLEEKGELELEQAYLDFLVSRSFNVRAGMMLMPVGIINERHEPPVFNGVERPFVDTVIIPTTWFDVGAGVHGEVGTGWRYRLFATAPLDATEFSAAEGLRGGAQQGAAANVRRIAATGRLEYLGLPDLSLGASFWSGESSFSLPTVRSTVHVAEADARYHRGRLELRGQFARVGISDAARLNASLQRLTGIMPNVARQLRGFYGEAAYRVWDAGAPRDLVAFVRYENFDTQYRMPDGLLPLKQFDRDAWTTGLTYYPDPDVAVKVDYVRIGNQSGLVKPANAVNLGLGWWF